MLALFGSRLPLERIHFLGRVSRRLLLALLQRTAAHVHLTYPYALSWSLIDAMACGAVVVGSDNPPVSEVIHHGLNGILTPFNDPGALTAWLGRSCASLGISSPSPAKRAARWKHGFPWPRLPPPTKPSGQPGGPALSTSLMVSVGSG